MRRPKKRNDRQFGRQGEEIAAEYLSSRGYTILSRNFRGCGCEIDIIAAEGDDTIVFVEVKRRMNSDFGSPADSVNRAKQKRIIRAAQAFTSAHRLDDAYFRFDVIAVSGDGAGSEELTHYEGAFLLSR